MDEKLHHPHENKSGIVTEKTKSILAASPDFFSPISPHQRIRGVEILERIARIFVDSLLTKESGKVLKLNDAYAFFRALLKQRELPDIKRSDFKAVVVPLIRSQFDVALRNDLAVEGQTGIRGWTGMKLIQAMPGRN